MSYIDYRSTGISNFVVLVGNLIMKFIIVDIL